MDEMPVICPGLGKRSDLTIRLVEVDRGWSDANVRVLIVEDERDLREALVEILTDAGYGCVEASDVEGARRVLATHADLDAVLLDLHLPGESAEVLIDDLNRRRLFTILTTADTTARSREIARRWSLEMVPKPFDVEVLLELLARHCSDGSGPPPIE
jgi:two-component system response regulator FlrC